MVIFRFAFYSNDGFLFYCVKENLTISTSQKQRFCEVERESQPFFHYQLYLRL
jgi:hypothetical protein